MHTSKNSNLNKATITKKLFNKPLTFCRQRKNYIQVYTAFATFNTRDIFRTQTFATFCTRDIFQFAPITQDHTGVMQ